MAVKILWLLLVCVISSLTLSGCNLFGRHSIIVDAHNIDRNIQSDPNGTISIELFLSRKTHLKSTTRLKLELLLSRGAFARKELQLRGHHVYQVPEGGESRDTIFIPDSVKRIFCVLKVDSQTLQIKELPIAPLRTKQLSVTIMGRDFAIRCE